MLSKMRSPFCGRKAEGRDAVRRAKKEPGSRTVWEVQDTPHGCAGARSAVQRSTEQSRHASDGGSVAARVRRD